MDILLILTYAALCIGVFKVFKLPLNKWTVPTAVLGGVVLVSGLMFIMNYNHPFSENLRTYFVTTPIIPNVSGTVLSVDAKPNQPLQKGSPLFSIDPTPFQAKVDSLTAKIIVANQDLERAETLIKTRNISQREVDQARANLSDLSAQLASANFDLANTTIKAPTDGFVTQVFLRPGMRAVAAPLRPVMVFVHSEEHYFTAMFRQNSLTRLKKGSKAEISLDGLPGDVFAAEVVEVLQAMREGQVQATGDLIGFNPSIQPGRIAVVMKITDPRFAQYQDAFPLGIYGQAAIYSEHAKHFAIIRKILIRMSAWMNYIYPLH